MDLATRAVGVLGQRDCKLQWVGKGCKGESGATKRGLSMGKVGLGPDKAGPAASEDTGALEPKASGKAGRRGGANRARPRIGHGQGGGGGGICRGPMRGGAETGGGQPGRQTQGGSETRRGLGQGRGLTGGRG